jgi:hypothetical protein
MANIRFVSFKEALNAKQNCNQKQKLSKSTQNHINTGTEAKLL